MKFFGRKDQLINHDFPIEDYIDYEIIASLLPKHQQLLSKLVENPSSSIEKLFNKIASNQVCFNADMLTKIFEHLTFQPHLPLEMLQNPELNDAWDNYLQKYSLSTPSSAMVLLRSLLDELKVWNHAGFSSEIIYKIIYICHELITNDECPVFNQLNLQPQKTKFWQKSPQHNQQFIMESIFKFIYEKIKFFHWELIPNTKRPIDLYELYCLIEDAALEQKIIIYSENLLNFLRPLNATALLHSTLFAYPMACPDYIANQIQQQNFSFDPFFLKVFDNQHFIPIFGNHLYLKPYNQMALIEALQQLAKLKFTGMDYEQILYQLFDKTEAVIQARYLENYTSRLIFTFNRLTSLGYLLRSPVLKGLGYHPLINTEVPSKLKQNFDLFVQLLKKESYEKQIEVLNIIHPKSFKFKDESVKEKTRQLN
jgi:hypothetical protein